jgi:hypothetical protein
MKKISKKPLSLSAETLRQLRGDDLAHADGGVVTITVQYSFCWTCGRAGCDTTSVLITNLAC